MTRLAVVIVDYSPPLSASTERDMPTLKKPVYEAIVKRLREQQADLRSKIRRRLYDMKKLACDQTLDKRQLAAIEELIRSMIPEPPKED